MPGEKRVRFVFWFRPEGDNLTQIADVFEYPIEKGPDGRRHAIEYLDELTVAGGVGTVGYDFKPGHFSLSIEYVDY